MYVLPNVCLELQSEDTDTRLSTVQLLGRLFASEQSDLGKEFHVNFQDFLKRTKDRDATIRLRMVELSGAILRHKPDLASDVLHAMVGRLEDADADVRLKAVSEIADAGVLVIDRVPVSVLKAAAERMKDRKSKIRKEATTGLCQVFAAHISHYWQEDAEIPSVRDSACSCACTVNCSSAGVT